LDLHLGVQTQGVLGRVGVAVYVHHAGRAADLGIHHVAGLPSQGGPAVRKQSKQVGALPQCHVELPL